MVIIIVLILCFDHRKSRS